MGLGIVGVPVFEEHWHFPRVEAFEVLSLIWI